MIDKYLAEVLDVQISLLIPTTNSRIAKITVSRQGLSIVHDKLPINKPRYLLLGAIKAHKHWRIAS